MLSIMFCNIKDWFIFEKIIGLFVFFCATAQFEWLQAASEDVKQRATVKEAKADGYEELFGYQMGNCLRGRSNRHLCGPAPKVGKSGKHGYLRGLL